MEVGWLPPRTLHTMPWLMKAEPEPRLVNGVDVSFSVDKFASVGEAPWDGVRNAQARNFMRDQMRQGDKVLFYHSSCKQPGASLRVECAADRRRRRARRGSPPGVPRRDCLGDRAPLLRCALGPQGAALVPGGPALSRACSALCPARCAAPPRGRAGRGAARGRGVPQRRAPCRDPRNAAPPPLAAQCAGERRSVYTPR